MRLPPIPEGAIRDAETWPRHRARDRNRRRSEAANRRRRKRQKGNTDE